MKTGDTQLCLIVFAHGFSSFLSHSYWYNNGCLFPDMGTVFIAIDKCDQENGCLKVRRTVTCCLLCGLLCGRCLLLLPPHMRVRVRLFDSVLEISWSYHSNKLTILLCWFRLESCPFQNLRSNLQNTKCFLSLNRYQGPQPNVFMWSAHNPNSKPTGCQFPWLWFSTITYDNQFVPLCPPPLCRYWRDPTI